MKNLHRWGEVQFLWFSFLHPFAVSEMIRNWWYYHHQYKRWQAGIQSLSSSKMQAKLKNALQLSFATCQHSPWFLMTFQMMHKPRIRNSNLQFCPISNFNLRCNFLQSLHFTVTLWTSFFKYRELLLFLYFIEGNKLSRFSVRCLKTQEVKGFHLHAMTIFELIHW